MNSINIGLVGAGTIGGGVIKILAKQASFFQEKLGLPVRLARVADKNSALFATLPIGDAICTDSADDVLNDPSINIVIELVGGTGFAKALVLRALNNKKHVITANKALLSEFGPEIFACAEKNGVSVYFEAAVGGTMPTVKTAREALVGNEIQSVQTIINGTCNYIMTKMTQEGAAFSDVLAAAQAKGYAEADPTLDIGGGDTAHKVSIMASLFFGGYVPYESVYKEGITGIEAIDIAFAKKLGYSIKLLGVIKKDSGAGIEARVHPVLLHSEHILASVNDVFNAMAIEGDACGKILLYGRGAGELPTASAVISDVIDVARNISENCPVRIPMGYYSEDNRLAVAPIAEISTRYYLRFTVTDRPNVLASIASQLADHAISIASVIQQESSENDTVPVVILTHTAKEKSLKAAVTAIEKMEFIKNATQVIRIED